MNDAGSQERVLRSPGVPEQAISAPESGRFHPLTLPDELELLLAKAGGDRRSDR
jgi:hypothetical protein